MKLHEALSAVTRDVAEIMDNAAPQAPSAGSHSGEDLPAVAAPQSIEEEHWAEATKFLKEGQTRQQKQLVIEEMVASFNPDAYEATELLDSLWAGVMERYGADEVVDLSKEFQELREALLEFDRTYKPSSAQDIKDWINDDEAARKAGL